MRKSNSILAVLLVLLSSCSTLSGVEWPEVVKCGPGISDVVGVVSDILLNGDSVTERLERLAKDRGYDTVLCVVDQLQRDWTAPGAAAHPTRAAAAERAQEFIESTGTHIVRE